MAEGEIIPQTRENVEITKDTVNVVDTYTEQIGYRFIEFNNVSGFFLNGKSMKLKGAALHNDFGAAVGTAAYDNAVKRYIDLLRDMGCNAIRTAHQPLSTNLMEYCARSGMMVFDEVFDEVYGLIKNKLNQS
mgnify:CR=1 FL=1